MAESLSFSADFIEIPVTVGGVDYVLREASGEAACEYRNAVFERARMDADGKPTCLSGLADLEPLLVSLCLFTKDGDKRVPLEVVRGWPSRVQAALFERAKEISGLGADEDSAKNGQGGTQTGSV